MIKSHWMQTVGGLFLASVLVPAAWPGGVSDPPELPSLEQFVSRLEFKKSSEAPRSVQMVIDHRSFIKTRVEDLSWGIRVEMDQDGIGSFNLTGDLQAWATRRGAYSLAGIDLMGGGVNVGLAPLGDTLYILSGIYQKDPRKKGRDRSLSFRINAYPNRDFDIREKGMDLDIRWNAFGYEITGTVDSSVYGKRELAILGGALAALTRDAFPIRSK